MWAHPCWRSAAGRACHFAPGTRPTIPTVGTADPMAVMAAHDVDLEVLCAGVTRKRTAVLAAVLDEHGGQGPQGKKRREVTSFSWDDHGSLSVSSSCATGCAYTRLEQCTQLELNVRLELSARIHSLPTPPQLLQGILRAPRHGGAQAQDEARGQGSQQQRCPAPAVYTHMKLHAHLCTQATLSSLRQGWRWHSVF